MKLMIKIDLKIKLFDMIDQSWNILAVDMLKLGIESGLRHAEET